MNKAIVREMLDRALAGTNSFPEILAVLSKEGVESYHVDFLRNECRYYSLNGESLVTELPFFHDAVGSEFSAERLEAINQNVQAGKAKFKDFVQEGTAAGCAYYIVYLTGKKVRYFGRNGDEYIQYFPGSRN